MTAIDPEARWPDTGKPDYAGLLSFGDVPYTETVEDLQGVDVAIVGAPMDDLTSDLPGARLGPRAIRGAAGWLGPHLDADFIRPLETLKVVDYGDAPVIPADPLGSHGAIERTVGEVVEAGAVPIVLGGDHSITYPSAAAVAREHAAASLGVVHFDAHADAAADQWGSLIGHGQPMRRLIEEGWVAGRNFVQVGLRGYWPDEETFAWMREQGFRWHTQIELEERGVETVIDDAIAEALDGPDRIYLSIDIDVVDPGMAPGTGTPESGGMLGRELLRAIRRIVSSVELVGMDVVEVSPPYDHSEITSMLAINCVMEAISALAAKRG
jgi:agmatinase